MKLETEVRNVINELSDGVSTIHVAKKLIPIAQAIDAERDEMTELLKRCEKQVGTYLGEEINAMVARVEGRRFNERDYHYERHPEGQE